MSNGNALGNESYKAGSFIFLEGQKDSKNFYIIRTGKVAVTKESQIVEDDAPPHLDTGDFFGVVSCMSRHPRIETAKAITDVDLIAINRDHFGTLIQRNTPIAMKIIRSFSKKLRFYDSEITRRTLRQASEEDPQLLYNLGEYYFNQKAFNKATYSFQKFLKYCPASANESQAKMKLQTMGMPFQAPPVNSTGSMARQYPNDSMIFSEHEPGEELYIIQQGKVKITKIINNQEVLLAVLQPGDIFGEMALLENKPRSASAIAYGDVVMLAVNKANFEQMVVSQPQIATKLIQLLSERIWTAFKQLANLLYKDPLARIYDTLLTQVLKKRVPIEHKTSYTFDFGQQELIKMLGIDQNQGNLVIRKLFENKKFTLMNGKIHLEDLEELEKQVKYFSKMQELERKREISSTKKMG
ncbi:MAG: cyclic nucleotide-binding domain-containing protein [Spirochaetes bacterium]|nr:cyclic nucleotide-binding domain-containing protein [Spirochaetota bacterium]